MSEAEYLAALNVLEDRLSAVYKERRELMHEYANRWPVAAMPPPRYRSEAQARVARCPRCSGRLDSEVEGAKK